MNTASYEWAARVRALNEIEVAKARAAHVVCVPLSAGGHAGRVTLPAARSGVRALPNNQQTNKQETTR